MSSFKVAEIIPQTIQGEGRHAGYPCTVLRLAGCNLWTSQTRQSKFCPFCDTPQMHKGVEMTAEEIVAAVEAPAMPGLIITGGEPLLQLTLELLQKVAHRRRWVDIETNGSLPLPYQSFLQPDNVYLSCSPKMEGIKLQPDWIKILCPNYTHLLPSARKLGVDIYLQPVVVAGNAEKTKENLEKTIQLSFLHGLPLSSQLHKHINLP
jgi:organic radical activating enzyme